MKRLISAIMMMSMLAGTAAAQLVSPQQVERAVQEAPVKALGEAQIKLMAAYSLGNSAQVDEILMRYPQLADTKVKD